MKQEHLEKAQALAKRLDTLRSDLTTLDPATDQGSYRIVRRYGFGSTADYALPDVEAARRFVEQQTKKQIRAVERELRKLGVKG